MLPDSDYESIIRAGRIACKIKRLVGGMVRPGISVLELAERIEEAIIRAGGQPAFPVNISINSEAAHYTPLIGDEKRIPEPSLVKVDLGVHVEGCLADTAVTVALGEEYDELVKAAEEALDNALSKVAPGVKASSIGEVIERTISSYGYRPIRNLSGHTMDRYLLHSGITIPNTRATSMGPALRPPLLIAIEPFATNGVGWVVDGGLTTIYSVIRPVGKKDRRLTDEEADLIDSIYAERRGLPFTERWYGDRYGVELIRSAIRKAERAKLAAGYPVLIESSGGLVSQAEDTVLLLDKESIITTREC